MTRCSGGEALLQIMHDESYPDEFSYLRPKNSAQHSGSLSDDTTELLRQVNRLLARLEDQGEIVSGATDDPETSDMPTVCLQCDGPLPLELRELITDNNIEITEVYGRVEIKVWSASDNR